MCDFSVLQRVAVVDLGRETVHVTSNYCSVLLRLILGEGQCVCD